MSLLSIRNLHASIGEKEILKGVNLEINCGEVHSIMGPNGNGKSTLAGIIAGNTKYTVTQGEVIYKGKNILDMPVDVRAAEGIFLGFQYPVEIPGVSITNFMRTAVNEQRKYRGLDPLSGSEFMRLMEEKKKVVEMTTNLANRSVNEGFSGGEKKKNEIFQMAMLDPPLPSSTRPTPASTSMPSASSPPVSTSCAAPTMPPSSSPTTSDCSTTSCPTSCMCSTKAALSKPVPKNWPSSSRRKATSGFAKN